MSDTAISSQVVSEVNTAQAAVKTDVSNEKNAQSSDFNNILGDELESVDQNAANKLQQESSLVNLDELLNVNPLLNNASLALEPTSGKALPGQLSLDDILQNNTKLNLAGKVPLEGEYKASLALVNSGANLQAKLNADSGFNLSNGMAASVPGEDDLLMSQITTLFNEKNLPNAKQLNTQLFNQFMSQANSQQQPTVDNTVLVGAAPGIIVNQSLSVHSSQAVLPAITVSPDNPQWNSQVGERINWMVNNNMQRADIRLDPPELGNLDIRLNIAKDNQASILIHVTNATAKEAIESAIPRLREMFEQQGLDLGNVDVSQQNLSQQQSAFEQFNDDDSNQFGQNNGYGSVNGTSDSSEILAVSNISASNNNLLDIFA